MSRLLLLASDLSGNAVYTPWQVGGALRSVGHAVTLAGASESDGPWAPLAEELAGAIRLPGPREGPPDVGLAVELARGHDAVYAFKAIPTSLGVGLRIREATGRPLLLHLDDRDASYFEDRALWRRAWYALQTLRHPRGELWLRRMEARIPEVDALTVSSRALQDRFGGTLVRQGLDTDRWDPARFPRARARTRLGVGPEEEMVLFLGSPRPHKGLPALEALAEGGRLWLVGGDEASLREAGVGPELLRRARVHGPVSFEEAAWFLAACDVFVVPQEDTPYARHQLPAKLLQAMAMGVPVVATDVGDARELLEGGERPAGVVVPPGEPEALSDAVLGLLRDPSRARGMGAEGRRRAVADLSWPAMARALTGVLGAVGVRG